MGPPALLNCLKIPTRNAFFFLCQRKLAKTTAFQGTVTQPSDPVAFCLLVTVLGLTSLKHLVGLGPWCCSRLPWGNVVPVPSHKCLFTLALSKPGFPQIIRKLKCSMSYIVWDIFTFLDYIPTRPGALDLVTRSRPLCWIYSAVSHRQGTHRNLPVFFPFL